MKGRKLLVIPSLVIVALLITTGVVVALGTGAVNQGTNSTAEGDFSTVSGGRNNTASTEHATVSGGRDNTASGRDSTVGGGHIHEASGDHSTIAGGSTNEASGKWSAIGGGIGNEASGEKSTVGGGSGNQASGNDSTIGGGSDNTASVDGSTIGGGIRNSARDVATVGGGIDNSASGISSTVGGGIDNSASGSDSTIGGGIANAASGGVSAIGGGSGNQASGEVSTIGGGSDNTASGQFSTIPGGAVNTAAGDFSFAAGLRARVNADHDGTFLFSDSSRDDIAFNSANPNEFAARATGGVRFVSAIDGNGDPTAGVQLAPGDSAWSALSDRNAKANFATVDGRDILERLSNIPIETWNYKSQDPSIRHIGPMAQDFHIAFGVGKDDKRISTVDADGVALAAIQGLYEVVEEKDTQIASLEARIVALEEAKGVQTGLLPFSAAVMWTMAGGLGLLLVTPGLVLGYRRTRRDQ